MSVQEIVTHTIRELEAKLASINGWPDADRERLLEAMCLDIFKKAFDRAKADADADTSVKALYRQLSLHLHPDKLESKCPGIYEHLKREAALLQIPQQVLGGFKPVQSLMQDILESPVEATQNLFSGLKDSLGSMLYAYKRYVQPFRFLVNTVSWIINIALIVALVPVMLAAGVILLTIHLALKLEQLLLNLITLGTYNQEIDNYTSTVSAEYKAEWWRKIKEATIAALEIAGKDKDAEHYKTMTLDDFQETMEQERFKEELEKLRSPFSQELSSEEEEALRAKVKSDLEPKKPAPFGFAHLWIIFKSFMLSLGRPLPEQGKFLSVISRPFQIIAIIPFIVIAPVFEGIRVVSGLCIIAPIFLAAGIKLVSLFILNLPLLLLDAARKLISAATSTPPEQDHTPAAGSYQDMARAGLGGMPAKAPPPSPPADGTGSLFPILVSALAEAPQPAPASAANVV